MSNIRKFVLYAVYLLVVIGLGLVLFFSFVHHSKPKSPIAKSPNGSQQVSHNPVITPTPQQSPATSTSPSSTVAAGDSAKSAIANATTTGTPAPNTTPTTGTLTNTGPGSVFVLFGISSLLAAAAYRLRLLLRAL